MTRKTNYQSCYIFNWNITDCTAPFAVGIVTDAMTDLAPPDAITPNILQSRGKSNLKKKYEICLFLFLVNVFY